MKLTAHVNCPQCAKTLRVPSDLVDAVVKCKFCEYILHLKKRQRAGAAPAPDRARSESSCRGRPAIRAPAPVVRAGSDWTTPANTPVGVAACAPAPQPVPAQNPHANLIPTIEPELVDYNPAFERDGLRHTGRGRYKGPGGGGNVKWIAVSFVVLVGGSLFAAVLLKPEWFKGDEPASELASNKGDSGGGIDTPVIKITSSTNRVQPVGAMGPFPRRMLAINVTNYMYMNSIQYGQSSGEKPSDRQDFYRMIDRVRGAWESAARSDLLFDRWPPGGRQDRYPASPAQTGDRRDDRTFSVERSRPQDRIVLLFAGHAIEKEGKAYLVPLEGEMDELETLIPLETVYAQLAKCPAQEKLIIFDVCRFDPGRGFERPAYGAMTEALDKALHASPDGVSVWTSCSPGQYSYEYDNASTNVRGLKFFEMYGSTFLNMLSRRNNAANRTKH